MNITVLVELFVKLSLGYIATQQEQKEAEEFCCRDNGLRNLLAATACSRTADRGRKSLYPPNRKFSVAEIALHALLSDTVACGCSMRLPLEGRWISLSSTH
jgi:hypothetical protein